MTDKTTELDKQASARLKAAFRSTKPIHGMTYDDLAEKLGVNNSSISHYMNGTNALNVKTLLLICAALPPDIQAVDIYPELFEGMHVAPLDDPKRVREQFYALSDEVQESVLKMIQHCK